MNWVRGVVRRLRFRLVSEPAPEQPPPGKIRCMAVAGEVVLTLDGLPIGVLTPSAAGHLARNLIRSADLCVLTGGRH